MSTSTLEAVRLLLRVGEAATLLGVCGKTVQAMADRGEIRRVRVGEKSIRYLPGDLLSFIQRQIGGQAAEVAGGR